MLFPLSQNHICLTNDHSVVHSESYWTFTFALGFWWGGTVATSGLLYNLHWVSVTPSYSHTLFFHLCSWPSPIYFVEIFCKLHGLHPVV
jgi:hypothetical protein